MSFGETRFIHLNYLGKSSVNVLVPMEGLEPPTFWFVAKRSIHLSYTGMVLPVGIEPTLPGWELDFKSSASADFATGAWGDIRDSNPHITGITNQRVNHFRQCHH